VVEPSGWRAEGGRAIWAGRQLGEHVPDLVAELVALFDPAEVWLFGSVSQGVDGPDSDIDVLVVDEHYRPEDALHLKAKAHANVTTPVPFDVAFTSPRRMSHRRRVAGTLERAAATSGRRVYARA
jgi:predicted nucleotidyltransferase